MISYVKRQVNLQIKDLNLRTPCEVLFSSSHWVYNLQSNILRAVVIRDDPVKI
jgi:hypothetical protein